MSVSSSSPVSQLVAGAPLPDDVQMLVVSSRPDLHLALSQNPFLSPATFRALYKRGVRVDLTDGLLNRPLDESAIAHVIDVAREAREVPITTLLQYHRLSSKEQAVDLCRRVRARGLSDSLLSCPHIADTAKQYVARNASPLAKLAFAASVSSRDVTDDAVFALASKAVSDEQSPRSVALVTQLLRARTSLVASALSSNHPVFLAAASRLYLNPLEQDALVQALQTQPASFWFDEAVACLLEQPTTTSSAYAWAASSVRPGSLGEASVRASQSLRALNVALPLSDIDDAAALTAYIAYADRLPGAPVRAWWVLDACRNPFLAPQHVAELRCLLVAQSSGYQTDCGTGLVQMAATMLASHLGEIPADLDRVMNLSAREPWLMREPRPTPLRSGPPGPLDLQQALASPVAGGKAWGTDVASLGEVLATSLRGDIKVWESLLGLADSFSGTVNEMIRVARASAQ